MKVIRFLSLEYNKAFCQLTSAKMAAAAVAKDSHSSL